MGVGARIKEQRRRINMTQETLAELVDVHANTIRKWEKEISYPNAKEMEDIAAALKTSTTYLYEGVYTASEYPDMKDTPPKIQRLKQQTEYQSMAYWGNVSDNIRKLIEDGNFDEISIIYPILVSGCEKLKKFMVPEHKTNIPHFDINQANIGRDATVNLGTV